MKKTQEIGLTFLVGLAIFVGISILAGFSANVWIDNYKKYHAAREYVVYQRLATEERFRLRQTAPPDTLLVLR